MKQEHIFTRVFDDRGKRKDVGISILLYSYKNFQFVELNDGDVGVINTDNFVFISEDKDCGWLAD